MKALFIKEIFSYFKSKFFYAMMFVYAVISMVCCFYFGKFFEIVTNNLSSFFYFQPNILAFIIPAIAVKLWSEERRSNTIELLSSLPLDYKDIVLAKFWSCFALGTFMLLMTIPFLIFAAFNLNLDFLSVLSSYFACLLALLSISAISCATAAFFVGAAVSYLISLFAVWLFFLLGFLTNFMDILYGQIGLDNVIYFCAVSYFALIVNIYLIKTKFVKTRKLFYFVVSQIICASLLFFISHFFFASYKFDASYSKVFSLSDEAKSVLSSYKEPVIIDLYTSDWSDESPKKDEYISNVARFLNKIPNATLNVKKIKPFSEEEGEAINYKLNFVPTLRYNLYDGVVFSANGRRIVINSINPDDARYFETDVIRAIASLNNNERKTVGILAGKPDVLRKKFGIVRGANWPFVDELNKHYNLLSLSQKTIQIPSNVDILLVLNQPESMVVKYAIDQYLMRGGKVVVLEDNLDFDYENKIEHPVDGVELFSGKFNSEFDSSVINTPDIVEKMLPHLKFSINNPLLVMVNYNIIGSEDVLDKEGLYVLFKYLDYLSDNEKMFHLNLKKEVMENESIKDKVENRFSEKYLPLVESINKETNVLKDKMIETNLTSSQSLSDFKKASALDNEISQKQEEAKKIAYLVEDKTSNVIAFYIVLNALVFPLFFIFIMIFVFEFLRKKYVKI
ncbi:MAG: Gldg family protein [Alphaproteobacteria bacterium]